MPTYSSILAWRIQWTEEPSGLQSMGSQRVGHNWVTFTSCVGSNPLKWSEVAQSCLTLCDPMDSSLPGSAVHGIFQARILEWAAISFFRGSAQPRDRTWVSCIADRCFTIWASRKSSNPLTRGQTWAPCIGSIESWLLEHQGSPESSSFLKTSPLMYEEGVNKCSP